MRSATRVAWFIQNAWHGPETVRSVMVAALLIGLAFSLAPLALGDDPMKWSVPARVLAEPIDTTAPAAAAPAMPRPAAVSTGLLPPQYQTTRLASTHNEPPPDDATLRFLVAAVGQPILVEAQLMIDGKPFRQRREARIDDLINQLAQLDSDSAAPEQESSSPKSIPENTNAGPADNADADNADAPESGNPVLARLQRYMAATKRTPSRDEIKWLLTNWANGPILLFVDANYQRVRSETAPLLAILDRDEDGVLAAKEIAVAEEILWKYDANRDEMLTFDEIKKGGERTPDKADTGPGIPAIIPLSQLGNPRIFQQLRERYRSDLARLDRDSNESISESELEEPRSTPPDLRVEVSFNSSDATQSRLTVDATRLAQGKLAATVRPSSVTLMHERTLLEFSAVQSPGPQETDQISLGAMQDGFPLLPEMDLNEDGKLTIREIRQVSKRLAVFDIDKDASISRAEVLPTLRVCFGLGPTAHRPLATVRSIHPSVPAAGVSPPDWFVRMDRNQDGDLTVREFLGGKEQFAALDSDQDGLVSVVEANESKK